MGSSLAVRDLQMRGMTLMVAFTTANSRTSAEIFQNHCQGKLPLSLRLASYFASVGRGIDEGGPLKTGCEQGRDEKGRSDTTREQLTACQ
jgi:hypothetical protein